VRPPTTGAWDKATMLLLPVVYPLYPDLMPANIFCVM
jgi:hypothetical protein